MRASGFGLRATGGDPRPATATRAERLTLAILAAAAAAALAIAATLEPDPRGHGTHERLGLPPCGLMLVAGVPCPSCGMTTAFAHAVRAEVVQAARVQPAGLVLALVAAAAAAGGALLAAAGAPLGPHLTPERARVSAYLLLGVMLAGWAYKVAVTLLGSGGS